MRSLYWKIFISFWLATILIIFTTAWITQQIVKSSSVPARERVFMDSYANAAVATFELGHQSALLQWLDKTGLSHQMTMFLLTNNGEIIGQKPIPNNVLKISQGLVENRLDDGIIKSGNLIISHEILSTSGKAYRLAAITDKPLPHYIEIPWAGLAIRLTFATFISGLICYLLSIYLTQPLRALRMAATSLATGQLSTRVGHFLGHNNDEIAELSYEFNRMAEELETLIYSKERLLQDISHELRSPLTRLQVAIELGRNKTNQLAATEFNRMEMECERLNDLISEILEFARLDKTITTLKLESVDIVELLNDVIQDANYEFKKSGTSIEMGKVVPCQLMVDKKLIHRAIENILRNALHYSPPNKPVIVTVLRYKDKIHLEIKDQGIGVPADQLEKIFNPFYRVDTSREKRTGGYGLGLAIAAQAIKLHYGSILTKNRKNGGLMVRIILPLATK
jgi:two-component system sensor histidine kinase CpxA